MVNCIHQYVMVYEYTLTGKIAKAVCQSCGTKRDSAPRPKN